MGGLTIPWYKHAPAPPKPAHYDEHSYKPGENSIPLTEGASIGKPGKSALNDAIRASDPGRDANPNVPFVDNALLLEGLVPSASPVRHVTALSGSE
ncbi:hypothetical protein GCM10010448_22500 [Streptomyces glomeratus]|uniref:Uncharacterized protein n=1 Tax=Streptomyces glomeratus TaxID=284452 RepID=A0ABP6LDQ8_9ACTN